jgi:pimeloyl-ACP methyl ester carboxylesterase
MSHKGNIFNEMKTREFIFIMVLVFLAMTLSLNSCRKDKEPVYNYFISGDFAVKYPQSTINNMMDQAARSYSGVTNLKSYVVSDANVYKLVYHTTIAGEEIEASGIVCTPSTPGEYPVLSFQNGTNTLYAYAPSVYLTYPYYQLVEITASLGFIVVIPDYPGFGSSTQVPHPYLITDPTVKSIIDMYRAVSEGSETMFPGVTVKNEYYLIGYSQGGWATASLHKALETDYSGEFNLAGSVCGAGPYNMTNIFLGIVGSSTYPMPSYLCYIINAYKSYQQFTNPVTDILNEPYASRLSSLYNGTMSLSQINKQLNDTVSKLFSQNFLSGYASSSSYSSLRQALIDNSVTPWHTYKPLFLGHGDSDTQVSVTTTTLFYNAMIDKGTSTETIKKVLYPGLDHDDALLPCVTDGLQYLLNIRDKGQI